MVAGFCDVGDASGGGASPLPSACPPAERGRGDPTPPPAGERGAWAAVIRFGGFFGLRRILAGCSYLVGRLGAIRFVWPGSVRIGRGDRGLVNSAGLADGVGAVARDAHERNACSEAMVAGLCGVGEAPSGGGAPLCLCLRRGRLRHLAPRSTLSAQRNPIRIPIPLTTQCGQRGREGEGGAVGGEREAAPLCLLPAQGQAAASRPAEHIECSTESDPDPDSADHSMWSAGERVERAARWVARAKQPPLPAASPPSGGRVETLARWVASAKPPPSASCLRTGRLRHLDLPAPPAPRGEQRSVGGGDQFRGIFRSRTDFGGLFLSGREGFGAIRFVWRGSVRIGRGDRGRLDPVGLAEASARLRGMRMNGTPVLRRW